MSTTSTERHLPVRTCVGCRRRDTQDHLVRCVLTADGSPIVSRTAPGRGAWVCGSGCVAPAIARHGFDRAWRRTVPALAFEMLAEAVDLAVDPAVEHEMAVRSGSTRHERLTTRVKG